MRDHLPIGTKSCCAVGPSWAVDPSRYFEVVATSPASNAWTVGASRLSSLADAEAKPDSAQTCCKDSRTKSRLSRCQQICATNVLVGRNWPRKLAGFTFASPRDESPNVFRLASFLDSFEELRPERFCTADPSYSKTLCNLQSFVSYARSAAFALVCNYASSPPH